MKLTRAMASLSVAVLLFAGCSEERSQPTESWLVLTPPGDTPATLDFDPEELEYETFSGILTGGLGGIMFEYSTTWGKNCLFALIIPPEATDPGWGSTEFTMQIPTKDSYLLHPELGGHIFLRLGPEHTNFLDEITVIATWMPWEEAPTLPMEYSSGDEWYEADVVQVGKRWRVTYQVDHFSDWKIRPRPPKTSRDDEAGTPTDW